MQTDVLVAGAGPTGLTLACDLARRGVAVRIVDRAPEFPCGSRGKGLSPRSLEVFDDLAVIDRMLACGITHMPLRKYQGAEVIAEVDPVAGQVPTPDVPYPVGLMIPQWRVEQILRERMADLTAMSGTSGSQAVLARVAELTPPTARSCCARCLAPAPSRCRHLTNSTRTVRRWNRPWNDSSGRSTGSPASRACDCTI